MTGNITMAQSTSSLDLSEGRFERGKALFEDLTGAPATGFLESLAGVAPQFARRALEWEFADMMGDSSLDVRTREIVAIATFATLGATAAPILKFRIATALRAGVSREEIIDVFTQISLGAGLPVALSAIRIAEEVFAAAGD
jgi:4-carboxymuconolactone decarboxylase